MTQKWIYAAIIEDDSSALRYLSTLLEEQFPEIKVIGTSNSVSGAITVLNTNNVDLVFMDIELTDGLSFDIFKSLTTYNFEVIFVTGFDNYLTKAFEHYAFNYLLKPVDPNQLNQVLNRYMGLKTRFSEERMNLFKAFQGAADTTLWVHAGDTHINLKTEDILYCTSEGNYTNFHLADKTKVLASNILKYYEELLGNKGFFRASRSSLVNIKHITSIYKKETLVLTNSEKVQVSNRNRTKLTELIGRLS